MDLKLARDCHTITEWNDADGNAGVGVKLAVEGANPLRIGVGDGGVYRFTVPKNVIGDDGAADPDELQGAVEIV